MSDDRERLRRYLEWQRARDKDRAAQRLRRIGAVAVGAVITGAVLVAGLAAWFLVPSLRAPDRIAGPPVPAPAVPQEVAAVPPSVTEQSRPTQAEPPAVSRAEPRDERRGVQSPARQGPRTSSSHAPKYTERAARGADGSEVAQSAGSAFGTLVYAPMKAGFCILGAIGSGFTYMADSQTAGKVARASCGGTWVITPNAVAGKESVHFVGNTDITHLASRRQRASGK